MKQQIFLLTLTAAFSFGLHAQVQSVSVSRDSVVLTGNPPEVRRVTRVELKDSLFEEVGTISRSTNRLGHSIDTYGGKQIDPKNYIVYLDNGYTISGAEALKGVQTEDRIGFKPGNQYIVFDQKSQGDRSTPNRVLVQKVVSAVRTPKGKMFYQVLDAGVTINKSHWVSWDQVKDHATYVPDDAKISDAIAKASRSAHVVLSEGTADSLAMGGSEGLDELSRIVDALSKQQGSAEELEHIRKVTLAPKLFPKGTDTANFARRLRSFIDDAISGTVKRAAPVASDIRPEDVAKEIKSDIIR